MKFACLLIALVLAPLSVLTAAEPAAAFWSYTDQDLFPSLIIATATVDWNGDEQDAEDKKDGKGKKLKADEWAVYGDENGLLAAEVENVPEGAQIAVEMSGEGFLKPSRWQGKVKKGHHSVRVFPKAVWDYTALHTVKQQRPAIVTVKVFYVLFDEEGEDFDDLSFMFAAYVNENHPWIDGVLKEALDAAKQAGVLKSFDGYQSGDSEVVIAQVFAIWNALQRRGIKYSSVTTTTPSRYNVCQSVRFMDESIGNAQANCVDGSVLMAAILRKIGIDVHLVMVPGHCFLAFSDGEGDDAAIIGLETTMLGQNDLKPVKDLPKLPTNLKKKEFAASLKTFGRALQAGIEQMEEHAEALDSGEDPDIQMISIEDARELGIMPLASGDKAR
jgi:hypothetical protein